MAGKEDLAQRAAAADDLPDPRDIVGRDEGVPIRDIFDDEFVSRHTDFETIDAMVAASPAKADSVDDLEHISAGEWNEFVAETTDFTDEAEFVFAARDAWVERQLGL